VSVQDYQFNQLVATIGINADVKAQERANKQQQRRRR
jgi:hypothetical protein